MSDRLQEIRERLDCATPGPWHTNDGRWILNAAGTSQLAMICDQASAGDLALIVQAPTDVAYLLDLVAQSGIVMGAAAEEIRREIRQGTPNTPERIAAIRRADEVFARSGVSRPSLPESAPSEKVASWFAKVLTEGEAGDLRSRQAFQLVVDAFWAAAHDNAAWRRALENWLCSAINEAGARAPGGSHE